jgi:hypothetical protein
MGSLTLCFGRNAMSYLRFGLIKGSRRRRAYSVASSSCLSRVGLQGLVVVTAYKGYRYPVEVIGHAVWLYHRFALSLRDVEELMLARPNGSYLPSAGSPRTFGRGGIGSARPDGEPRWLTASRSGMRLPHSTPPPECERPNTVSSPQLQKLHHYTFQLT